MTTVHVAVGLHGDTDRPFVHECDPGEYDDTADIYEVDIPAALLKELDDACDIAMAAENRVIDATGYDTERGRMKQCCPEWHGDEHPGRRWWKVVLAESGDENVWPVRDVDLGRHFYEPGEAEAWIETLPERFHMFPGYGRLLVEVERSRFSVEYHSYSGRVSACYRCGWERDEHGDAA